MSSTPIEVVRVISIHPHPYADKLEIVKILGTQVCAPLGDFKVGDLAVYFPPDMMIPEEVADDLGVTAYLKHSIYPGDLTKSKCRIAAVRLRQIPSVGFLIKFDNMQLQEGEDLTKHFRGEKYNTPMQNIFSGNLTRDTSYFPIYTNIQHYYRHKNAIPEGLPVRITEKVHGCLKTNTRVRMADGSSKMIQKIQPGDYVAGMDEEGHIVASKVLNVFKNGATKDWLKIRFKREMCGRGNSYGAITCTRNHQFFLGDTYKEAAELKEEDELLVLRSDWYLSHIQEQILLGKMLGDGYLAKHPTSGSAHIGWSHKSKELVEWTVQGLGDLCSQKRDTQVSGYGSLIHRARTHDSVFIADKFNSFIKDDCKIVPKWVAKELTPLAMAFWYMDDGSLGHYEGQEDRALFATCSFTKQDCDVLIKALKNYNIEAVYYENDGYSRLRLNADEAEKFFLLITPYIPKELQYKLPERYRGHEGWLPKTQDSYKQALVPQKIISITPVEQSFQRWDLETETHNYMPSSVVTHNSNSRIGLVDDTWMCGTHRTNRLEFDQLDRRSLYWQPLTEPMKEMILAIHNDKIAEAAFNSVAVYGEIFGVKVQAMDYGVPEAKGYRVFDISVGGEYLDWEDVKEYCNQYSIPTVPLLFEGPFNHDLIDEFISGPTTICEAGNIRCSFKGREGIVITPLKEQFNDWLQGRLILKAVSPDYYQAMK